MTRPVQRNLKPLFLALALGGAAAAGISYFSASGPGAIAPAAPENAASRAQQIVAENMKKSCAQEAASLSALVISDPNLKCNGPHIAP